MVKAYTKFSVRAISAAQCSWASLITWTDFSRSSSCSPSCVLGAAFRTHRLLNRDLHWLRVLEQIRFSFCVLTDRCLNGAASSYLFCSSATTTPIVPTLAINLVWPGIPCRRCTRVERFAIILSNCNVADHFLTITDDILFHSSFTGSFYYQTSLAVGYLPVTDYVKCHCNILATVSFSSVQSATPL